MLEIMFGNLFHHKGLKNVLLLVPIARPQCLQELTEKIDDSKLCYFEGLGVLERLQVLRAEISK